MFKKRIEMPPKVKYQKLTEVVDRVWAEMLQSYLKANGVETQLVQDAFSHYMYSAPGGFVQVLVPNIQMKEAQQLLADFEEGGESAG